VSVQGIKVDERSECLDNFYKINLDMTRDKSYLDVKNPLGLPAFFTCLLLSFTCVSALHRVLRFYTGSFGFTPVYLSRTVFILF
jgi:hypothetical protein